MQEAAESRQVRGGGALPQPADRRPAPVRDAGGRSAQPRLRGCARRGRGRRQRQRPAVSSARRAAGRPPELLPREHRGRGRVRGAVGIRARVLRRPGRRSRPRWWCHGRSTTPSCWRRSWGSGAARPSRCAPPSAARSAESPSWRLRTRRSHSSTTRCWRSVRGPAGWRRWRSCASDSTWRSCRCGSSASTSPTWATPTPLPPWWCSRTRSRSAPTIGRSRSGTARDRTTSRACGEAVSRRFARMRAVEADRYDESFAATPSLVVIDGGKGQLNAALEAMAEFDLPRVAVISLAKRIEEVFIPGRPDPIMLDPASNGLQLLQRVRDEAHRFALGSHRKRRARSSGGVDLRLAARGGAGAQTAVDRALRHTGAVRLSHP